MPKALQPGERGLIKVTTNPDGTYTATLRYREHGGDVDRIRKRGATASQAEASALAEYHSRVTTAEAASLTIAARDTFADACARWLEFRRAETRLSGLAPQSVRAYTALVNNQIPTNLLRTRIEHVTSQMLMSVLVMAPPGQYKGLRSVLRQVLDWCVLQGALPANPMNNVPRFATGTRRSKDHEFTTAHMDLLLEAIDHYAATPRCGPRLTADAIAALRGERWFRPRWIATLPQSIMPLNWGGWQLHAEYRLADGTIIMREGFLTKQGDSPTKIFGFEAGFRAALGTQWVSLTGWPDPITRQPGSRHANGVAMYWIRPGVAIPTRPETLMPPRNARQYNAEIGVLGWMVNHAFEDQRMARPEVVSVEPLTTQESNGHIWRVDVRLYGGVSLADVRKHALSLRSSFNTAWLRVLPTDDGVSLFMGADPTGAGVVLAQGERTARFLETLDLEQAFLNSGIAGKGGLTPTLVNQEVMPRNQQVRVLDYRLPPGMDLVMIRGGLERLRVATNSVFLSPTPGVDGASSMRLLMSREDPMPARVPFDWTHDYTASIAMGSGIDGDHVGFRLATDPHLLIAGGTGGGKSSLFQSLITGLLLSGAHIAVVDAQKKAADFAFAKDWYMATATTVLDAAAVLEAVRAENLRRAELNGQYGVGSTKDLPAEVRPPTWVVFIDEFLGLIRSESTPSPREETDPELEARRLEDVAIHTAKKKIAALADRIMAEARSADIHLVVATQKLRQDDLKNAPTLKVNASRILLGKTTYGDRQSALREADEAPDLGESMPKGRGIFEPRIVGLV